MEEGGAAAEEPHTDIKAGNEENGSDDQLPVDAVAGFDGPGQDLCTILCAWEIPTAHGSNVGSGIGRR